MKWPTIEQFSALISLPEGFRLESLKRSDVPELARAVGRWHPDIAIGGGSSYLRESFYAEHVHFGGGPKVLVPDEELALAAFLYALATLKNPYAQRALERAGYRLLGFFPGRDREQVSPGVVKRVYRAVYAKLLVPEDQVHWPETEEHDAEGESGVRAAVR